MHQQKGPGLVGHGAEQERQREHLPSRNQRPSQDKNVPTETTRRIPSQSLNVTADKLLKDLRPDCSSEGRAYPKATTLKGIGL